MLTEQESKQYLFSWHMYPNIYPKKLRQRNLLRALRSYSLTCSECPSRELQSCGLSDVLEHISCLPETFRRLSDIQAAAESVLDFTARLTTLASFLLHAHTWKPNQNSCTHSRAITQHTYTNRALLKHTWSHSYPKSTSTAELGHKL